MKCHNKVCKKNTNTKYCSTACAAKVNNTKFVKRKLTKVCFGKKCNNKILSNRVYCSPECRATIKRNKTGGRIPKIKICARPNCEKLFVGKNKFCSSSCRSNTYNIKVNLNTLYKKDLFSSRIREIARAIYNASEKPKECIICGYSLHYDVCHIKSIKSFNKNSKVSEINNIDNLIAMCKNHHWEFDNGYLSI